MFNMKNKHIFLLAVLCLSAIFVPVVHSPMVPILEYGPLEYRDIKVDGSPEDWQSITHIVEDEKNDDGVDYQEEDIKAVSAANNDHSLFFLMELYEAEVSTVSVDGGVAEYRFYIDVYPDSGDPENNGADYYIEYREGGNNLDSVTEGTSFFSWRQGQWHVMISSGVQGAKMGSFIEVSVPLVVITDTSCFNCFFKAHYEMEFPVDESDFAPDQDAQYVMIGCCRGSLKPVGGEILPNSVLTSTLTWIAMGLAALAIPLGIKSKKRMPY